MTTQVKTVFFTTLTLFAAFYLGACSKEVIEQEAVTPDKNGTKSYPAPAYIKPGPSITLVGQTEFILEPNSESEITIQYSTKKKEGKIKITAFEDTGFQLSEKYWEFDIGVEDLSFAIPLQTGEAGRYYLMFEAELEAQSGSGKRVQGVKLLVGEQPPITQKTTKGGITVMEAEETIY